MGDPMASINYPFSEAQLQSIHTLWGFYRLQSDLRCPSVDSEQFADFQFHWAMIQGVERNALQAQVRQFGKCALPSTFLGCSRPTRRPIGSER
jgi:hypothetical protein